MSFLTLAQGDSVGKGLLKKMAQARYGGSPPALETLRVTYQGRSQARIGPIPLWARVEAVATYRFPDHLRWDFKLNVLRILRSAYSTAFDGQVVSELERGKAVVRTDAESIRSARTRAWAETVFFISPLITDERVRVERIEDDPYAFRAFAPDGDTTAALGYLHEDGRLKEVTLERVNPVNNQSQRQRLVVAGELTLVDRLIMPATVQRFWDDELSMELTPVGVELNPELAPDTFKFEPVNLLEVLDDEEDGDSDSSGAAREEA
jgi:hypothetical protein